MSRHDDLSARETAAILSNPELCRQLEQAARETETYSTAEVLAGMTRTPRGETVIDAQNEIARNVALHEMTDAVLDSGVDLTEDGLGDTQDNAENIALRILNRHVVHFERDVNDAGVAVRRVVLRSEWEVDPDLAISRSGSMVIVENDRERVGADAVSDALADAYRELSDGPRIWTERALDGVRLDRVSAALQRAAERLGVRFRGQP